MANFENLVGKKFNRLTVIERAENILHADGRRRVAWICACDCGNTTVVETYMMKSGAIKSCGCLKVERNKRDFGTHGGCRERLYSVWCSMKKRCYNPKYKQYKDYGGRGIKVCDEWLHDYANFKQFALENGYNPQAGFGECTIDRINVDGDYSPDNCRFVDIKTQNNNKRRVPKDV